MRQQIVRFVETGSYAAMAGTHLGCPLGLGNHHLEQTQADAARNVREILRFGGVYYGWQYARAGRLELHRRCIPITPVELREGMVLGRERIHTARSGRFGWPDGSAADVYVVDSQGCRVTSGMVREIPSKAGGSMKFACPATILRSSSSGRESERSWKSECVRF